MATDEYHLRESAEIQHDILVGLVSALVAAGFVPPVNIEDMLRRDEDHIKAVRVRNDPDKENPNDGE